MMQKCSLEKHFTWYKDNEEITWDAYIEPRFLGKGETAGEAIKSLEEELKKA